MNKTPQAVTDGMVLEGNCKMVLREEGEAGAILFNPDTGSVQFLNSTAAAGYKLFDGCRTLAEVKKILQSQFRGFDADAESSIVELVAKLLELGAITQSAIIDAGAQVGRP